MRPVCATVIAPGLERTSMTSGAGAASVIVTVPVAGSAVTVTTPAVPAATAVAASTAAVASGTSGDQARRIGRQYARPRPSPTAERPGFLQHQGSAPLRCTCTATGLTPGVALRA